MSNLEELFLQSCASCSSQTVDNYVEDCAPVWQGNRINELLLVPCDADINDTSVLDTATWTALFCGNSANGRRSGVGVGSLVQTGATAIDTGANCGIASLVSTKTTYELTFIKRTFDDSEDYLTHKFYSELKNGGWNKYKVFARMCNRPDEVLPIGKVALTKDNYTIPEGIEDVVQLEIGLSWKQHGYPTPIKVAGLDAALEC